MNSLERKSQIIDWISNLKSSGNDQLFYYKFKVGHEGEFIFHITGGKIGGSDPPELIPLKDYKEVSLCIFSNPINLKEESESSFDIENYSVKLNIRIAPNPIHPQEDVRFKEQEWASKFKLRATVSGGPGSSVWQESWAQISLDTLCEIMIYCDKIFRLKAFW
jgi:hypothetical protein